MRGLHNQIGQWPPVHVVPVQLDIIGLPDHLVHVSGFGG
jgi:hypothetical protein